MGLSARAHCLPLQVLCGQFLSLLHPGARIRESFPYAKAIAYSGIVCLKPRHPSQRALQLGLVSTKYLSILFDVKAT
jgi:hypothetical protein